MHVKTYFYFYLQPWNLKKKKKGQILEHTSELNFPLLVLVQNDVPKESPGIKSSDSFPGQCDLLPNCQCHHHFQVLPSILLLYGFKSQFASERKSHEIWEEQIKLRSSILRDHMGQTRQLPLIWQFSRPLQKSPTL